LLSTLSFPPFLYSNLNKPGLDRYKCCEIGLLHDLAESVIGDIPSFAGVSKDLKQEAERYAFDFITHFLPHESAMACWSAWINYEHGLTSEGRFMKQLDKLECLIQAQRYEQHTLGRQNLEEFQGLIAKITMPEFKPWLHQLHLDRVQYHTMRKSQNNYVFIMGQLLSIEEQLAETCKELAVVYLSVPQLVNECCQDHASPWRCFLSQKPSAKVGIPSMLVVALPKQRIETLGSQDHHSVMISGFPHNTGDLVQFEVQMQTERYDVINLQGSKTHGVHQQPLPNYSHKKSVADHVADKGNIYLEMSHNGNDDDLLEKVDSYIRDRLHSDSRSVQDQ
jgi:putative hydrolase of HD superfamily